MNCNCEADVMWCELCAREREELSLKASARALDITYDVLHRIVEEEDEEL